MSSDEGVSFSKEEASARMNPPTVAVKVVIAGAGFAGLAAGRTLMELGWCL